MPDTIVAVATPAGRGAVGIVRLSGPHSASILEILAGRIPEPRRATHLSLRDEQDRELDDVVVIFYAAPASYTGDDVVEIQAHGNPAILQALVERVCAQGARLALPGEFTARAYLNGRLDLLQAEAVADVINGHDMRAVRAARRSLNGIFGATARALGERLQHARASLEAGIDFADDLGDEIVDQAGGDELEAIHEAFLALRRTAERGMRLSNGASMAIVGAPNVGKSSLLNALAGYDRAIVSPVPGTTRDLVDADLAIGAVAARLVDTAGLRDSDDPVEREGIRRSHVASEEADLTIIVTDDTPAADAIVKEHGGTCLVVHNKIDQRDEQPCVTQHGGVTHVHLCALDGRGIDGLVKAVETHFDLDGDHENEFTAHARHVAALDAVIKELALARTLERQVHGELIAEHYRAATQALEIITGRYDEEALLGDIFAHFCIGK